MTLNCVILKDVFKVSSLKSQLGLNLFCIVRERLHVFSFVLSNKNIFVSNSASLNPD